MGKIFDGDFFDVADVHHFADRAVGVDQFHERLYRVPYIAETTGLFSIAVNGDGRVVQRLTDEIRKDHAVAASLARADSVEETDDDDGNLLFFPVREGEKFVECFGGGVTPAAFGGGAEDEIGFLAKRNLGAFSVDLGGGGGENEFTFSCGGFENVLRAVHVGFDGAHGAFDDQANANGGGEMDDNVSAVDEFGDELAVFNGVEMIFHPVGRLEMADVFHAAGGEIVEQHDVIAAIQEPLSEMRADKAGTSGD